MKRKVKTACVNHNRFLGYTKDAEKHLVIVPEEAEIIKRIYREYLEGANYKEISEGLEADGILTAAGKPKWHSSTLKKILTNEKYMGDALLQKTYTVDCLTKKRVANDGTVPQYYVNNDHGDYSERTFCKSAGRNEAQDKYTAGHGREKTGVQQQICVVEHCLLRALRRYVPQNSLEQPRQKANCVEVCYKAERSGCGMSCKNIVRSAASELGAGSNQ